MISSVWLRICCSSCLFLLDKVLVFVDLRPMMKNIMAEAMQPTIRIRYVVMVWFWKMFLCANLSLFIGVGTMRGATKWRVV